MFLVISLFDIIAFLERFVKSELDFFLGKEDLEGEIVEM